MQVRPLHGAMSLFKTIWLTQTIKSRPMSNFFTCCHRMAIQKSSWGFLDCSIAPTKVVWLCSLCKFPVHRTAGIIVQYKHTDGIWNVGRDSNWFFAVIVLQSLTTQIRRTFADVILVTADVEITTFNRFQNLESIHVHVKIMTKCIGYWRIRPERSCNSTLSGFNMEH